MDESFELPVTYQGEELLLPAALLQFGYTHKFRVEVYGQQIVFEPDEERNYRAMLNPAQMESSKIDVELLQAVAEAIEGIVK